MKLEPEPTSYERKNFADYDFNFAVYDLKKIGMMILMIDYDYDWL